ncbi:MAG: hypothetical protein EBR13_04595 [Rhodobacteraceae bacterium]|nr:hypothetical protein [Paracoccaceae bacterium]
MILNFTASNLRLAAGAVAMAAFLTGCVTSLPVDDEGYLVKLPEDLVKLAAEGQDIGRVRLMEDNCYWYLYNGMVETTLLPILTEEGRMICNQ